MPSDGPEVIVWHEGVWRCELWTIGGSWQLRVFDGPTLIHQEPFFRTTGDLRVDELRLMAIDGRLSRT